jgi:hypothetical protein
VTRLTALLTIGGLLAPLGLQAQKPKRDRDVITRDELVEADTKSPDLYQAVKRLRPHFLTVLNRGPNSTGVGPGSSGAPMCDVVREPNCQTRSMGTVVALPVVYVDGMKTGDPEVLKTFATKNVEEVRYLTASKAEMEFGLGHEGGAILVKLIKSP